MKIVVTCRQMARDIELMRPDLEELGLEVSCPPVIQHLEGDELVSALQGAVGVIAGDDQFTAEVMDRCPELRAISKWGIGVDGIDKTAAAARGISVTNTPGMFDDEVADVAYGYLVMLTRQLHHIDRGVRDGGWPKPVGTSLRGTTLGIVGLGGTGRAMARRGLTAGMTVIGSDPSDASRQAALEIGVRVVDIDEVVGTADHLSLHCPLTPQTRHLLDRERFASMREGIRIINTARGQVIDEAALIEAIRSGRVGGAALDVFEGEPLPADSPLRHFDNVILGSHNASNAKEAGERTHRQALDNLLQALEIDAP